MNNSLDVTVVGDVAIFGKTLRDFLKKSHYFLSYGPKTHTAELYVNHARGGEPLIVLRNVDYEVARKLAENLGLLPDHEEEEKPLSWTKWNPVLILYHDGSSGAEKLRMEILRLGIPHVVNYSSLELALQDSQSVYRRPLWSIEKIIGVVREIAKRYKEQLNTTP